VLRGTAAPTVTTAIGALSLSGVRIDQQVRLLGMNNLTSPPAVVNSGSIYNTSANSVQLTVSITVFNPSSLSGNLGPVSLDIIYQGLSFVVTQVNPLAVAQGYNTLNATGVLTLPDPQTNPGDYQIALSVLARFLSGRDTNVTLSGSLASSPSPLLAPAFAGFSAASTFPGLPGKLIENGTLYLDIFNIGTHAPGRLWANNPLDVQLTLLDANLTVYYCKNEIDGETCGDPVNTGPDWVGGYSDPVGFFYDNSNGTLFDNPIVLQARSSGYTKAYPILLLADGAEDLALIAEILLDGDAITKLNGTLTAELQRNDAESGGWVSEPIRATVFFDEFGLKLYTANPPAPA
jgi:hypothetical protein